MSITNLSNIQEAAIREICDNHKGDECHLPFEDVLEEAVRTAFVEGGKYLKVQLLTELAEQLDVDILDIARHLP